MKPEYRAIQGVNNGLSPETHDAMNQELIQQRVDALSRLMDEFRTTIEDYVAIQQSESEPEPEDVVSVLDVIHQQALDLLAEIQSLSLMPEIDSDPQFTRGVRLYEILLTVVESGFDEIINNQLREAIDVEYLASNEILYYSAYDVLSEEQRRVLRKLEHTARDSRRLDVVFRQLAEIQMYDESLKQRLPVTLLDYAADVILDMESIELDYTTEAEHLDNMLPNVLAMDRLPDQFDILRHVLPAQLFRVARLYAASPDAAQPMIAALQAGYFHVADGYQAMQLGEFAYMYKQRGEYLQELVETIATHRLFYSARLVPQE